MTVSHFQAPARVPTRVRPRTLERPHQRPRIIPGGEGTSTGVPQAADVPSDSGSGSQTVLGRLRCPPDMMVRCWMPSGELSRKFLRPDTTLEPVFIPDTATHVSFIHSQYLLLISSSLGCC